MEKVVRDDLPVNVILGFATLEESQRLRQVVVEYNSLVSQLSDQEILLLDLLLERKCSLELLLRGLKLCCCVRCPFRCFVGLLSQRLELRL